ncbi:MAG: RsmG family class I SAM-dependent methyltransferase, partial [Ilumatobacteraceae bacterium]
MNSGPSASDGPLLEALEVIRRRGGIGEASLIEAVAHADRFVDALPLDASTLVDLGSGGGLPALVIAWRRPDIHISMVERRVSRS